MGIIVLINFRVMFMVLEFGLIMGFKVKVKRIV